MRRGFKAEAERLAKQVRSDMGIKPSGRLDAMKLALHAGAEVQRADDLTSRDKLEALEALQPGAFSACTFHVGERRVVVYNTLASDGRTQSDIAHEIAHILLEHDLQTVQELSGLSFFTCDPDEEQEANWLAGCLLLPRPLVLRAAQRGLDAADMARQYGVSETMAAFRLRSTGVMRQLKAGGASRQNTRTEH